MLSSCVRPFVIATALLSAAANAETIQVDITPLLNARIVTTLSNGKVVHWKDSLDNAGSGMATQAAANHFGNADKKALPDDGFFPANGRHPDVQLHFSNAAPTGNQVHRSIAEDSYCVKLPKGRYTGLQLFCMSGMGNSEITVTLHYSDNTDTTEELTVPDWWNQMRPEDPQHFDLASDMGKWDDDGKMMEPDHHYITGINVKTDPSKVLEYGKIEKKKAGVLTLWGITGVTR